MSDWAARQLAEALGQIGESIRYLADRLSTGSASTDKGGMEIVAEAIREAAIILEPEPR